MWRAALRLRHAAPCATLAALTRCDEDTLQKRTTWKASSDKLGPPRVHRIVITGGPCAGKTTAMAKLSLRLQNMGFDVFVVPEVRDAAWFPAVSELQYHEDGVNATRRRRDAVDAAVRVVPRRSRRSRLRAARSPGIIRNGSTGTGRCLS